MTMNCELPDAAAAPQRTVVDAPTCVPLTAVPFAGATLAEVAGPYRQCMLTFAVDLPVETSPVMVISTFPVRCGVKRGIGVDWAMWASPAMTILDDFVPADGFDGFVNTDAGRGPRVQCTSPDVATALEAGAIPGLAVTVVPHSVQVRFPLRDSAVPTPPFGLLSAVRDLSLEEKSLTACDLV
jgi:hypothetical protein